MPLVSSLSSNNLAAPGAFVQLNVATGIVANGAPSNVVAIIGYGTKGQFNVPIRVSCSSSQSLAPVYRAIGTGTTGSYSMARMATTMFPLATEFLFVRIGDGSQVSATANMLDAANATLLTLIAQDEGTNGNGITSNWALTSGTLALNPVFSLSVFTPNGSTQTFSSLKGSLPGGAYDATILKPNALNAVNGLTKGVTGSQDVIAMPGPGTAAPLTGTVFTASGGADGALGLTQQSLVGVASSAGGSGVNALVGFAFSILAPADADPSIAQELYQFVAIRGGIACVSAPPNLTTDQMLALKALDNATAQRVLFCADWINEADAVSGAASMQVCPAGAVGAVYASLDPWLDGANKPVTGIPGVLSTERTAYNPVDPFGEGATRFQNGIIYATNSMPRGGGIYGLPHGMMSDGVTSASDVRMGDLVASIALQVLGKAVGDGQTPLPKTGFDYDLTRETTENALNQAYEPFLNRADPHLANLSVTFIGTNGDIAAGRFPWAIVGQTLAGIKFAFAAVTVGTSVTIDNTNALGLAA